jgi:hypothetical protein
MGIYTCHIPVGKGVGVEGSDKSSGKPKRSIKVEILVE